MSNQSEMLPDLILIRAYISQSRRSNRNSQTNQLHVYVLHMICKINLLDSDASKLDFSAPQLQIYSLVTLNHMTKISRCPDFQMEQARVYALRTNVSDTNL